jgi:nucleoid-associated protein EbfC
MSRGGGFPGMGGNMAQMMKQAQKMQQDMQKVQQELVEREVETTVGGGVVKVVATCNKKLKNIEISPAAVDPDDIEMLQDLILAAVNEALEKAEETSQSEMAKVTGGLGGLL